MPWTDVLDQARATDALRAAHSAGRVAHAYLFHGPAGVGKRAAALAFARTLLCERGGDDACGGCGACRRAAGLTHPDLHLLLPCPNDTDEHEVADRLQALAADPYAPADFVQRPAGGEKGTNKQVLYSIERVHEDLRRPMSYRPVEGRFKVAVLVDADLLRVEAANAFLKLLEEPAPQTVFVLTTTRLDRMLPTIVSRCQAVRFDPLPDDVVADALVARAGQGAGAAAVLARMAGGSYTRALALLGEGDLAAHRDLVLRFLRHAVAPRPETAGVLDEVAGLAREPLKAWLDLVLRFTHDLVRYRTAGAAAALVNVDQAEAVARFCERLPHADLEGVVGLAEEARELAERNVHTGLVVRVLAARLRSAIGRGVTVPLYEPLARLA